MEALNTWWAGLTMLNHGFYIAALFFSVFFLWQLIMAVIGMGAGDTALDSTVEGLAVQIRESWGDSVAQTTNKPAWREVRENNRR